MAHTNIMGFGLPFSLTLPILLRTLVIVQVFFQFFSVFLPANGPRLANSKRINVNIQGTVMFYSSRRRMVMSSVCFSERTSFLFRVISSRPSLSV